MFKFQQKEIVKDSISGLVGVVVSRTEWSNGCIRYGVQARELKDGKPIDLCSFDEQDLESVGAPVATRDEAAERRGGPKPEPARRAEPTR